MGFKSEVTDCQTRSGVTVTDGRSSTETRLSGRNRCIVSYKHVKKLLKEYLGKSLITI